MAANHLKEHVRDGEEDPGLPGIVSRPMQADFPALDRSWIKSEPSLPLPRVSS